MNLRTSLARILAPAGPPAEEQSRSFPTITLDEFARILEERGLLLSGTLRPDLERIESDFPGLVSGALKGNTIVFALEMIRMLVFSEARFQFRRLQNGRPTDLFGTQELRILERPWPNGTTGDLLARMILLADLAGNAYAVRRPGPTIKLPRPDWMTIVIGSPNATDDPWDIDRELVGYQYHPGGIGIGRPISLLPSEVAHFAPIPDPMAMFRGMSWLTPVIREVEADTAATLHKLAYFRNGATANQVVKVESPLIKTAQDFRDWIDAFEEDHRGATNAYRTLYLLGGMDVTAVGSNLQQAEFKVTQGAGESRLAAAAGVPAPLAGFSEGLAGSALNAGNYATAKRRFADGTMRPLWRNAAGSLASIVPEPAGSQLWYDARDIPFLAEDSKDAADVTLVQAQAIRQLVDGGYEPDSVVSAVVVGDLSLLAHSGLYSVQLQPPGSNDPPATATAAPAATEPAPTPAPASAARSLPGELRCSSCDKLLAEHIDGAYRLTCPRCRTIAESGRSEPAPLVELAAVEPPLDRFLIAMADRDAAADARTERLVAALADRPITVEAPVTIAEGAIRAEVPVTIAEGAIRVDSPVTIEAPAPTPAPDPVRLTVVRTPDGAKIATEPA